MCTHHNNTGFKKIQIDEHDQEHKDWSRRSFIQALGLVGGGTMMLGSSALTASTPSPLAMALSQAENDNILVIIRLKGGNDGLNTIVPLSEYDLYANARPDLRIAENRLINLSDEFAMPNFMTSLESIWGDGKMKVVHSVGYPDQDLSHFRSSDIWASTEPNDFVPTGWFGRYFEELFPDYLVNPPEKPAAVQIGSIGNLIFDGVENNYAFTVANPNQLNDIAQNGVVHDLQNLPECVYGDQLEFMRGTTNTTYQYAGVIHDAYINSTNDVEYIDDRISNQLAIVSRLIKGGLGTKVYMVSLGGFDTHANQIDEHESLMKSISIAVKNFYDDLATTGIDSKVLSMTISEFGRRVEQNGSMGTDHGSSAPILMFGPALNGSGFVGTHQSLADLDIIGNLKYSVDFRQVYATVLKEWLCIDQQTVDIALLGQQYDTVNLGFQCGSLSVDEFELDGTRFSHFVSYEQGETILHYNNPSAAHMVIKLYNILGQEIATLKNDFSLQGSHSVNIKQAAQQRLSRAQYIYRISIRNKHYSKSVLIK